MPLRQSLFFTVAAMNYSSTVTIRVDNASSIDLFARYTMSRLGGTVPLGCDSWFSLDVFIYKSIRTVFVNKINRLIRKNFLQSKYDADSSDLVGIDQLYIL